eukprot:g11766.t1
MSLMPVGSGQIDRMQNGGATYSYSWESFRAFDFCLYDVDAANEFFNLHILILLTEQWIDELEGKVTLFSDQAGCGTNFRVFPRVSRVVCVIQSVGIVI